MLWHDEHFLNTLAPSAALVDANNAIISPVRELSELVWVSLLATVVTFTWYAEVWGAGLWKIISVTLLIPKTRITAKKIETKIDLIKIDVNGHELSVVKGLSKIIKRDRPALIIETGDDIKIIGRYLKKYGFEKYLFLNKYNKFIKIKKNYPLNTYFLQRNHLKLRVTWI